ncbi:hypothetical protein ACFLXP_01900 [Chloroflexota bacterium]
MAENRSGQLNEEQVLELEQLKRQLDMLDNRLDNIDSMVSAVAERIMNQPVSISITCPYCSKNIEISMIGNQRPRP